MQTNITPESLTSFENYHVSVRTVMVYTNIFFKDRWALYDKLPLCPIDDIPLTKKQKQPSPDKVKGPPGSIFSISYKNKRRGIPIPPNSHKKKRKTEEARMEDENLSKLRNTTTKKSQEEFRNALCLRIIMPYNNLHLMIFNDCIKLAGCKEVHHAYMVLLYLWEMLKEIPESWVIMNENQPTFVLENVMINVNFGLGINLDRAKVNEVMNLDKYDKVVNLSKPPGNNQNNVQVIMPQKKPENMLYNTIQINNVGKNKNEENFLLYKVSEDYYQNIRQLIYLFNPETTKKNSKPSDELKFLIYRTGTVMISGRYLESMNEAYKQFIKIITENQECITEIIDNTPLNIDLNQFRMD